MKTILRYYKKKYIDSFKRKKIDELKKLEYILQGVTIDDLFLRDDNLETYFEYIVENKIRIDDDKLIVYISNNYDLLKYVLKNGFHLKIID